MTIPPKIVDLIERFDEHRDAYRSPEYNEAQVRDEFIDPMFEALGWDIHNRLGFAEQFKQVVHEDCIRIGGAAKAPDYSFRLGGRRIFFLEAKKPSVNLREDPSPAYQLRRYAWTAKLPVSILSDFEEFIVYDTRVKPVLGDKASTSRVLYLPYAEYPERWEEIASLFSPQAIQKGALDKYVESTSKKRGTAEVDDAFLAEIEEWRDLLAHNIALRNSGISQRELNYAVQTTIDRIVFLRICEDRAIEPYAQLMALQNGSDVYARLRVLYERADERYNSGLFHFHKEKDRPGAPDTLTPGLDIDDKVLKDIIKRLYYPESPYEFSVLPAEILGQVYERFLGSVIRLTSGGHAKVEQKPEVRKAGGVYYTPSYIVDYIVKHTVGKLLEGKTPQEVAGVTETWRPSKTGRPLAVLDPACGSGSFLLGAYQYLLDWHLEYYSKDTAKWSTGKEPRIYQDHRGVWRLVTSERKRILLANIYGVDIDAQAVEVTKLSLLLRVLEGENADTLQKQFTLFHERALPDLANNIKCGNSLIEPDFYEGKQLDAFDEEETYRINAFDWNTEFPQVMGKGTGIDKGLQPLVSHEPSATCEKGSQPLATAATDKEVHPLVQSPDIWFVTFVTHCSRISERMVEFGVTDAKGKGLQPLVFTSDEQIAVAESLFDIARRHGFAFIALNVLPDHVHAVIPAPDEETLSERVRMLKVFSAQVVNRRRGAGKGSHVWAQKFNRSRVKGEDDLNQICKYVYENHLKHQERWGSKLLETWDKGLQPLVPTQRTAADSPFASSGGFDAVIGNPPYVRQEGLGEFKEYFQRSYQAYTATADLYVPFIEKGVSLLRDGGLFSYIVANKWMRANYGKTLRQWLKKQCIEEIVDFGDLPVFRSATTYPCVLRIAKRVPGEEIHAVNVESLDFVDLESHVARERFPISISNLQDDGWTLSRGEQQALLRKIREKGIPLAEYVGGKIYRGVLTGLNEAFVISAETRDRLIAEDAKCAELIKPFLAGRDIKRYAPPKADKFLILIPRGWTTARYGTKRDAWNSFQTEYPAMTTHLQPFAEPAQKRYDKGEYWWELRACDYYGEFEKPKIIVPAIVQRASYCCDSQGHYSNDKTSIVVSDDPYLLGILNSPVPDVLLHSIASTKQGGYYEYKPMYIGQLPIPCTMRLGSMGRSRHDKLVSLVQRMLDLHKRLQTARTDHERGVLERQITATDEEIDHLVYALYDLTPEEIAIVEEPVNK